MSRLVASLPAFVTALAWIEAAPAGESDAVAMETLIGRMAGKAAAIRDYTCTFTLKEMIGDVMKPTETIALKGKGPSTCVYMKWIGKPYRGRETIYCEGRYGDELQAHEDSGIASLMSVSIDPHGRMAMRNSRHPITEAGLLNSIRFALAEFERGRKHPEHGVRQEKIYRTRVRHQPSTCAIAVQPDDRALGYRAPKAELCIHEQEHLPTRLRVWDEKHRLVETYTYSGCRLNVGLTDHDFDVENEEYGF